jgi:hypothetical protein
MTAQALPRLAAANRRAWLRNGDLAAALLRRCRY